MALHSVYSHTEYLSMRIRREESYSDRHSKLNERLERRRKEVMQYSEGGNTSTEGNTTAVVTEITEPVAHHTHGKCVVGHDTEGESKEDSTTASDKYTSSRPETQTMVTAAGHHVEYSSDPFWAGINIAGIPKGPVSKHTV